MGVFIGLDPGGKSAFGWCVTVDSATLHLRTLASGAEDEARAATDQALSCVPPGEPVLGVGIDAPLIWSWGRRRAVDEIVRSAIRNAGAPHPAGTVQSVNSLRGACLVQGLLGAIALRRHYPSIPVVESHPKALLWMMSDAQTVRGNSEHERDAILCTFSAWAAIHKPQRWSDLYEKERQWYSPLEPPIHYLMPVDLRQQS